MASLSIDSEQGRFPPRRKGADAAVHALVLALRSCWSTGQLTVTDPGGARHLIAAREGGPEGRLDVRDARFVRRVIAGGDIGFAESFMAGEWDSPDLAALLTAFSANYDAMARLLDGSALVRLFNALTHARRRNSRKGSQRNIAAHYDLGDDFYALWLDGGMNYSSGLYAGDALDLAAAQQRKHAALADAMDLRPDHTLLEIGCGWGDFACFAARERQAKVVAVTVSPAQYAHASARMQAEGLAERVEIRFCDYRDIAGRFDRIGSIEMFEAVGEAYWQTYFRKVHDLLIPGGRAALQVITIEADLFEAYRRRPDFIQTHIFPGGMLPSEQRLRSETERAGLSWTGVLRFGADYARTLAEWARRYKASGDLVRAQGFDNRFDRMWRYYLAYCEAGFRTGRTDVVQLGLARS